MKSGKLWPDEVPAVNTAPAKQSKGDVNPNYI